MENRKISFVFEGAFDQYCLEFTAYKRGQGIMFGKRMLQHLQAMNHFFGKYPMEAPALTKEMVLDYVSRRGDESPITQNKRITLIRQFAEFMNLHGFSFYVCQKKLLKTKGSFTPYIFTREEINRVFWLLDSLPPSPYIKNSHLIYPMLFRLLYGCGLRINEALSLKREDIDLENGTLLLRKAKNNSSRLVPMSGSLSQCCVLYSQQMAPYISMRGYFFPAPDGGHYSLTPVYLKLKYFFAQAGIYREDGNTPRIHDVRHTFSVHTLEHMSKQGWDLYCSLPVLSEYLGHTDIKATEKYLRLTEDAHNSITESLSAACKNVFPEVADGKS